MLYTIKYFLTTTMVALDLDTETDTAPSRHRARTILVQAALLGVLADATVRNGPLGIGWTALVAGMVLTIVVLALSLGERITRERAGWLGVAMAAAIASAWRDAEMLRFLNLLASVGALSLAAMTFSGTPAPSVLGARARDIIGAARNSAADALTGTVALVRHAEAGALVAQGGRASLPALR